ncbi:hypothetical protein [Nostoc sp. T09]|nr:hypothetical protein [Nostoc sp. T09]
MSQSTHLIVEIEAIAYLSNRMQIQSVALHQSRLVFDLPADHPASSRYIG